MKLWQCLVISLVAAFVWMPAPASAQLRPVVVSSHVVASNDDAEERLSDGAMRRTSTDLELIDDTGDFGPQTVGIRFADIPVPQGAVIVSAVLELWVDETDSAPTSLVVRAEAADDAAAFGAGAFDISSRPLTAAAASWSALPAWSTVGEVRQSVDLFAVVQEVIDRPGFASGNALVLVVTGSGERTAVAFDGDAAMAPVLRLEYGGTPVSPGAGRCWAAADQSDRFVNVDAATGVPTEVGPLNAPNVEAIAINPANLSVVGADEDHLGLIDTSTGELTSLPMAFGSADGSAGTIVISDVDGLAFDRSSGVLYGLENRGGADALIQIDAATGAVVQDAFGAGVDYVLVAGAGIGDNMEDLAFHPSTGTLYGVDGSNDNLVIIDPATGAASVVGGLGAGLQGLGFDPAGTLYGTAGRRMYAVSLATGQANQIGTGNTLNVGNNYEAIDCDISLLAQPAADLSITKDDGVTQVLPSDTLTYTITASNAGPATVARAVVRDLFPADLTCTWTCVPSGGATCTAGPVAGNLEDRPRLPALGTATYTAVCTVAASASGAIANTVTIASFSTTDPTPGDNEATDVDILPLNLPDGGFEEGSLGGCWVVGGGGAVEALQATNFSPQIAPPGGSWMALLSSGGAPVGGLTGDLDGNGVVDNDGSTLTASFVVSDAPTQLCFDWSFLTSEEDEADQYDDFFSVKLNGTVVLSGSVAKAGASSPYPDVGPYDGISYAVSSTGGTNGSVFDDGRTGFTTFCTPIATNGAYTLELLVADQVDNQVDTGLLIDNVQVPGSCVDLTITQVTDSGASTVEAKGGALVASQASNGSVAISADSSVMAWVSNANLTGDNPSLQSQVFAYSSGSLERITALSGADVGRPSLDASGRWLAFATTGDPTPGSPGNADASFEIIRWDRQTSTALQITGTTSCTNSQPFMGGGGGEPIAFATDCTDLAPGFNADGSSEVVVWSSGGLSTFETTGCSNLQPSLSDDAQGRYLTFLSTCDLASPANADGSMEVFQIDRVGGGVIQATSSSAAAGELNDSLSVSGDGSRAVFVSNASYTGNNPDQSLEVFLADRASASITQLTDADPLTAFLTARIDASGRFVVVERLDLLLNESQIRLIDLNDSSSRTIASGDPILPVVALVDSEAAVAFQAATDYTGGNADGNSEIWANATALTSQPQRFCSAPGMSLPDPGTASDTLSVGTSMTIIDLNVELRIEHTWVGDLTVTLTHVDTGTSVAIVGRPGNPASTYGCSGDDIDAVLDDEAAAPVEDECAGAVPTIEGTFTPNQLLSAFDGEDLAGDWTLVVDDAVGADTGTLVEWCLVSGVAP